MAVSEQPSLADRVADFLAQRRIAVAGVSSRRDVTANSIYRKLKTNGYEVVGVSTTAESFEGDPCYPDLLSIPGGVDGVVIVTRPEVTSALVRQCAAAGVRRVWIHGGIMRSMTSVPPDAEAVCREHGIAIIAGACPMMFCKPDVGHRCMRWMLRVSGGMPS